jgi:hypothetical protein
MRLPVLWVTTCLVLGALAGCGDSGTKDLNTNAEMLEKLKPKLPVGMGLKDAQTLMETEGFACELQEGKKWKGKGEVNFLECKREDGIPPIKRMWLVAVFHDGKKVTGFDVRTALKYP